MIRTEYRDCLQQNKIMNNNMTKKVILTPVTWFYGIRFDLEFDDVSEPVLHGLKCL